MATSVRALCACFVLVLLLNCLVVSGHGVEKKTKAKSTPKKSRTTVGTDGRYATGKLKTINAKLLKQAADNKLLSKMGRPALKVKESNSWKCYWSILDAKKNKKEFVCGWVKITSKKCCGWDYIGKGNYRYSCVNNIYHPAAYKESLILQNGHKWYTKRFTEKKCPKHAKKPRYVKKIVTKWKKKWYKRSGRWQLLAKRTVRLCESFGLKKCKKFGKKRHQEKTLMKITYDRSKKTKWKWCKKSLKSKKKKIVVDMKCRFVSWCKSFGKKKCLKWGKARKRYDPKTRRGDYPLKKCGGKWHRNSDGKHKHCSRCAVMGVKKCLKWGAKYKEYVPYTYDKVRYRGGWRMHNFHGSFRWTQKCTKKSKFKCAAWSRWFRKKRRTKRRKYKHYTSSKTKGNTKTGYYKLTRKCVALGYISCRKWSKTHVKWQVRYGRYRWSSSGLARPVRACVKSTRLVCLKFKKSKMRTVVFFGGFRKAADGLYKVFRHCVKLNKYTCAKYSGKKKYYRRRWRSKWHVYPGKPHLMRRLWDKCTRFGAHGCRKYSKQHHRVKKRKRKPYPKVLYFRKGKWYHQFHKGTFRYVKRCSKLGWVKCARWSKWRRNYKVAYSGGWRNSGSGFFQYLRSCRALAKYRCLFWTGWKKRWKLRFVGSYTRDAGGIYRYSLTCRRMNSFRCLQWSKKRKFYFRRNIGGWKAHNHMYSKRQYRNCKWWGIKGCKRWANPKYDWKKRKRKNHKFYSGKWKLNRWGTKYRHVRFCTAGWATCVRWLRRKQTGGYIVPRSPAHYHNKAYRWFYYRMCTRVAKHRCRQWRYQRHQSMQFMTKKRGRLVRTCAGFNVNAKCDKWSVWRAVKTFAPYLEDGKTMFQACVPWVSVLRGYFESSGIFLPVTKSGIKSITSCQTHCTQHGRPFSGVGKDGECFCSVKSAHAHKIIQRWLDYRLKTHPKQGQCMLNFRGKGLPSTWLLFFNRWYKSGKKVDTTGSLGCRSNTHNALARKGGKHLGNKGKIACIRAARHAGFAYAAIMGGNHCWGIRNTRALKAHTLSYMQGANKKKKCSAKCMNGKAQGCGGEKFFTLYKTPATKGRGCFQSLARAVRAWTQNPGWRIHNHRSNPRHCSKNCGSRGYKFFAIRAGQVCLCGARLPPNSARRPQVRCNSKCKYRTRGYTRGMCGGSPYWMSVHEVRKQDRRVGPYRGCWRPKSATPLFKKRIKAARTAVACASSCGLHGYKLSAMRGSVCTCGTHKELRKAKKYRHKYCHYGCSRARWFCGGPKNSWTVALARPSRPGGVGCYSAKLKHKPMGSQSRDKCLITCGEAGYKFAATRGHKKCVCLQKVGRRVTDYKCNSALGVGTGNSKHLSVYIAKKAKLSSIGCVTTKNLKKVSNKLIKGGSRMTPKQCLKACLKKKTSHFTLTMGKHCSCVNLKRKLKRSPESKCRAVCQPWRWYNRFWRRGCGGTRAHSVYSTGISKAKPKKKDTKKKEKKEDKKKTQPKEKSKKKPVKKSSVCAITCKDKCRKEKKPAKAKECVDACVKSCAAKKKK